MSAVEYEELEGGGFRVTRVFRNRPSAMAAVARIGEINEVAFEPVAKPLDPATEAYVVRTESAEVD